MKHLSDYLRRRDMEHTVEDDVIEAVLPRGHYARANRFSGGYWIEAYAPGIPDTPRASMSAPAPAPAADLILTWWDDLEAGDVLTARCECGRIFSPRAPHSCGHTE